MEATLPQLPPTAERLKAFDSVPLFMRSLDDAADDQSPALAALQSLAHEGTPNENAQTFKDQGNEYFKGRRTREALGFYTQGIEAKPSDLNLLNALLCNRAACNLELENYGSALRDCSRALSLDDKSSKAYYRSALALLALDRPEEALDCSRRCLTYDPENAAMKATQERAEKANAIKVSKEKANQERLVREAAQKTRMEAAYKARNLIVSQDVSSNTSYAPIFDSEDPTGQTLIIPVVFLYPEHAISDIIPQFVESTPFSAHLEVMFPPAAGIGSSTSAAPVPPDWDQERKYLNGRLIIYAITKRKRLLKVGKKMTPRDVCNAARGGDCEPADGLELKNGCLTFVVLPKGGVEKKWVEDFKRERDAEQKGS